jgi:hypothetical protein
MINEVLENVEKFILNNMHIIAFDVHSANDMYFPKWSYQIFEKHFAIIEDFFKSINMPLPKIVKVQFKYNTWRVYFKEIELDFKDELKFLTLVDDLQVELERSMMAKLS